MSDDNDDDFDLDATLDAITGTEGTKFVPASEFDANPDTPAPLRGFTPEEWCKQHPPTNWLVKGLVPEGVGMLIGAPGAGKSTLALDIAHHIVRNQPWQKRKVRGEQVLWLAAEAQGSMAGRLEAAAKGLNFTLAGISGMRIVGNCDLIEKEYLERIAHLIPENGLVVIDTLSAATPSLDENSKEMQHAINIAVAIRQDFGASVLFIHHTGKDVSRGARGWSGLTGAVDYVLQAEVDDEDDPPDAPRLLKVKKQRDGDPGLKLGFKLVPIVIGKDADGDPRTNVYVEHCAPPSKAPNMGGKYATKLFETLINMKPRTGKWTEDQMDEAKKDVSADRRVQSNAKRALERNGVIRKTPDGYELTDVIKQHIEDNLNIVLGDEK